MIALEVSQADAQIARRNFVNPSFEQPDLDVACSANGTTWRPVDADSVPGWETTHSLWSPGNACGGPTPYRAIEFWESGFLGVNSQDGSQHVELNANESSRIYQSACLLAGESASYSYYHRARSANPETSRAVLFDETGAVQISQGPADAVNVADGWVQHTGALTNNGSTGPRQLGFVSVNSGSLGNFLDLVELRLRPLVELLPSVNTPAAEDDGVPVALNFQVNGVLDNAATFTLALDVASSASPADFLVSPGALTGRGNIDSYSAVDGTITITVPAGTYDPNESNNTSGEQGQFSIPITYTIEAQIEPDESIVYMLGTVITGGGATASRDIQFNDADCDGAATANASLLIVNDDLDLTLTKILDTPEPYQVGQSVQYTLVVSNLSPGAAAATNVMVSDTPSNLTITSVTSPSCNTLPCTILLLPGGTSETIVVTATVDAQGTFLNTAGVTSDQADQNPADNSDLGIDRNNGGYVPPLAVPVTFLWSMVLMALGVLLVGSRATRHKI